MHLLLLAAVAWADEQSFTYDLRYNGIAVGRREVTVKYLDKNGFERRVVSVHTKIDAPATKIEARSTGMAGSTTSFTTAVEVNGERQQIEAQEQLTGGWRLIVTDAKGSKESSYTRTQARLSTLDLVDPQRVLLLQDPGTVGLIVAETGELLTGTVGQGQPETVDVGGVPVAVTRYQVVGQEGTARFDVDVDGNLVQSELRWLGGTVTATLSALPGARVSDATLTIEGFDPLVREEGL